MGIKVIAKVKDDVATVKLLVKHPMDPGSVAGSKKPEKFINHLTVKYGDKLVYDMYPTGSVSKNPYIKFAFKGAKKGDNILVEWVDNTGETEKQEAPLK